MIIIDFFLYLTVFVCLFFSLQLILGSFSFPKKNLNITNISPTLVLIPAHNESAVIADTLSSVLTQLAPNDRILVVADNCSDNTVEICGAHDVEVIERQSKEHIGKGYALQYGVEHTLSNYEEIKTIVVLDADCLLGEQSLCQLVNHSQNTKQVVQAKYLMKSPDSNNIKLNISEFTWLIKNWIRPLGQRRMGFSCHLQGSGMAFPIEVLQKHSLASSSIVEDLEFGLKLASQKIQILFYEHASVFSFFPQNIEGMESQRKRWEHGHLSVISKMPKQILEGVLSLNYRQVAQALDAAIPPTIMWILLFSFLTISKSVSSIFFRGDLLLIVMLLSAIAMFLSIAFVWFVRGKQIVPVNQFFGLAAFVFSKLGVYSSFVRKKEKGWVKTKRDE